MLGTLELGEVAFEVGEVGGRVAAVDPRQCLGRGASARDERADVEVGVAELLDGVVHRRQRLFEPVAAAAGCPQGPERGGAEAGQRSARSPPCRRWLARRRRGCRRSRTSRRRPRSWGAAPRPAARPGSGRSAAGRGSGGGRARRARCFPSHDPLSRQYHRRRRRRVRRSRSCPPACGAPHAARRHVHRGQGPPQRSAADTCESLPRIRRKCPRSRAASQGERRAVVLSQPTSTRASGCLSGRTRS